MRTTKRHYRSKAGFADLYLERYGSGIVEGLPDPDPDLFLIITIPAYKEPDLAGSISSLLACDPPGIKWEIIVNVNYPESADPESVRVTMDSFSVVRSLAEKNRRTDVRIISLLSAGLPNRHAGVGLARKIAMDQAVVRFNQVGRPDGIIAGFDADSSCDRSYLAAIVRFYLHHKEARTANVFFEHPLPEGAGSGTNRSIAEYELYLRYMRLAIRETGHPHAIHTVGSSFTVRCKTYVRVNGMGRDKAGEDFYFLHKCIRLGGFWEINDTAVLPSARESDRVIFGTGAAMQKQNSLDSELRVYNLDSFYPLKQFFSRVGQYRALLAGGGNPETAWTDLPESLRSFLQRSDAAGSLTRIFRDSAGEESFTKKFFEWFTVFMILKYLNDVHKDFYGKLPVTREASVMAVKCGLPGTGSAADLLKRFREFERGSGNIRIS